MSQETYEQFSHDRTEQEMYGNLCQDETGQEVYYNTDRDMPTQAPGPPLPKRDANQRSTKEINTDLKDQCNIAGKGYEPDYRAVRQQERPKSKNTTLPLMSQEKWYTKRAPCSLVAVFILSIAIALVSLGAGMGIMYGLSQSVLKNTEHNEEGKGDSLITGVTTVTATFDADAACTEPENIINRTDFLLPYNTYQLRLYVTASDDNTSFEIQTKGRGSYDIDNLLYTSTLELQKEETFIWKNNIYWNKADLVSIMANQYASIVVQFNNYNYDSYYSLPDSMLGYSYTVNMRPTSTGSTYPTLYITVGDYDDTLVEFSSTNIYVASVFKSRNLTTRQQVAFSGNINVSDFTGLEIRSTRAIAVVNSHPCFYGPAGSNYLCSTIAEQFLPDNLLGRFYIIPKFLSALNSDGYYNVFTRVLALNDTKVDYQYGDISLAYKSVSLPPGLYDDQKFAAPVNITCSIPCSVVSYLHYYNSTSYRLPPSMLIIPGTNLFKIGRSYFSSDMTTSEHQEVNLAIVTSVGGNSHMLLNGAIISTEWSTVLGTDYIYTALTNLPRKATNILENNKFKYIAYLYGGYINKRSFSHVVALHID